MSFNMFLSGKFSPATLLAAIAMLASGCMTAEHELVADDTLLLDRANSFFARERFAQASESYNKLVNEFPDSIYRKAGLIGLADSMYKEGRFEEANLYYERFVELYPLDTLTPRAWFYFGMCHLMITSTPDRSQRESLEAIDVFTDFLRRYPDHELAPTAKWYRKQMEGMIEESKLEVARFYHRTNKNGATIARLKDFLEEYKESEKAPEAMFLLGVSYMREQAYSKAAEVFTILIGAYPENEWAVKARSSALKLALKK